jgi:hypothetical protein
MDIALTPDTYTPSVDNNGNYVDNVPIIQNGMHCPCSLKKAYDNTQKFNAHVKTKTHQRWLMFLNQNKANYYIELIKCKELLETQKQFIAKLESQLRSKTQSVEYLLEQITTNINNQPNVNLLDLD